ncbi:hypothetical protein HPB50_003448 [Hyalomma asiaticum]|uniref:Uncharacterized protein n=1 Tax=Hyalomma asiaticum TaxID=266040 RepID=A0ACB7SKM1_HYAAI|nr:hypothetical protein HPB50_003448 [Hyalomma asiaticum]
MKAGAFTTSTHNVGLEGAPCGAGNGIPSHFLAWTCKKPFDNIKLEVIPQTVANLELRPCLYDCVRSSLSGRKAKQHIRDVCEYVRLGHPRHSPGIGISPVLFNLSIIVYYPKDRLAASSTPSIQTTPRYDASEAARVECKTPCKRQSSRWNRTYAQRDSDAHLPSPATRQDRWDANSYKKVTYTFTPGNGRKSRG